MELRPLDLNVARRLRELRRAPTLDLTREPGEIGKMVTDRAREALKEQLEAALDGPLAEAASRVDLKKLDPQADVRAAIVKAMPDTATEAELRAARIALGRVDVASTLNDLIQPGLPADRNPLLSSELDAARTMAVAEMAALPAGVRKKLAEAPPERIDDDRLSELVSTRVLNKKQAAALGRASDLLALVGDDDKLASVVRGEKFKSLGNRTVESTDDLALLTADEVRRAVKKAAGDSLNDDAIDERAKRLLRRFEALDPQAAFFAKGLPEADAQPIKRLQSNNPDVNLLEIDLRHGSATLEKLDMTGIGDAANVEHALKTYQRVYGIAGDAAQSQALLAAGFGSSASVSSVPYHTFLERTKLGEAEAQSIYARAAEKTSQVSALAGTALDAVAGGFNWLNVFNIAPEVEDFLKDMPGYTDLFGSLDYCDCEHCRSILGPAAYFVDLMTFIELHVTEKHFAGTRSDLVLNLRTRRPDLWTMELTCENTDTLIPTLTIVNEVLERYVASRNGFTGNLADLSEVAAFVYGNRLATTVSSFRQPFLLPLHELETYLGHFERTRAEVAALLDVHADVRARAALSLSTVEHTRITTARDQAAFLKNVYNVPFSFSSAGAAGPVDAQVLIGPIGVTRDELGELVETWFVDAGGAVSIQSEKLSDESVQNDVEHVRGLTRANLDRMHRFVRLWKAVPWSIGELDLVLRHADAEGLGTNLNDATLRLVVALREIQERFDLSVEEVVTWWSQIPRTAVEEEGEALFDRLFNQPAFVASGGHYPKPSAFFVHPSWDPAADLAPLYRLIAGLRVSDETLYNLIVHLAGALGIDLSATPSTRKLSLSHKNLSLLYRHARLTEKLDLAVPELFQLMALASVPVVGSLADLHTLLETFERWSEAEYTLEVVTGLSGGDLPEAFDPAALAARVVEDAAAETVFADSVLAYLDGISEDDSRAILAANPAVTTSMDGQLLRLADDADPSAVLTLPAGITVAESDVRAALMAYHPSGVLTNGIAAVLEIPTAKAAALVQARGLDLLDPALAAALHGGAIAPLEALIRDVLPLHLLLADAAITDADVAFVEQHAGVFGIADVAALPVDAAWRVDAYRRRLAADETLREGLQDALVQHDGGTGFAAADPDTLGLLLDADPGLVATVQTAVNVKGNAVDALERLAAAVELAQHIGIGGEALARIAGETYDTLLAARDAVLGAFRAKYADENRWIEAVDPFDDVIRMRKRDALVDDLLYAGYAEFDEPSDLYHHFLLDVFVDGCARTSRVVEGTASLQLYVHRCLMNLERNDRPTGHAQHVHVKPDDLPADEWVWRKNYRVWEANRRVFLYPETYIEPELRDDKTPLFEALEEELLAKPVDEQSVLEAYSRYVSGFEEVSSLRVAGAYHDEGTDTDILHVIGVTSDDPPVHYYRTVENAIASEEDPARGIVYNPWKRLDVQIPSRYVSPVVFRGTLYLFWNEITTRPKTDFVDGESRFDGYYHAHKIRYTARKLDGTWTTPQNLDMSAHTQVPYDDGPGIMHDYFYQGRLYYSDEVHDEPKDGFTLRGVRYEQIFPDVHESGSTLYLTSGTYKSHASVDFYANALSARDGSYSGRAIVWKGGIERGQLVSAKKISSGFDLYVSTPDEHLFDDYAYASIAADSRRIDAAEPAFDHADTIRNALYQHRFGRVASLTDIVVVNGAVSDAILNVDGDLIYAQGSTRTGDRVLVRRFGTTLGEPIGRTLVADGVPGLLSLEAQQAFEEASSPVTNRTSVVSHEVVTGRMDFEGPYGTYLRELFFHIPFLIADHLNSQQRFAEAQKWYHYIFDPTASAHAGPGESVADAERDRVWRYLEFRGLDVETLREQLTNAAAIEVYEKDPFNPHAIARLRLSAYQKSIVMKYIDNLLDWGDHLFSQDTREAITEATMLYVMASDILGKRPAKLGSCGEGTISPKSYEKIAPLLDRDTPFLAEMEQFVVEGVISWKHEVAFAATEKPKYTYGKQKISAIVAKSDRSTSRDYVAKKRAAGPTTMERTDTSIHTFEDASTAVVRRDVAYRADWTKTHAGNWIEARGVPAHTAGTGNRYDGQVGKADVWIATHGAPGRFTDMRLPSFGVSLFKQVSPVFCVPRNKALEGYWTRVEDRLYKIRHCMNISGVRRSLALFAPEIDPMLLVRARAAGLSLEDALGLTRGELPPYRFAALIGRAKSYAQTVQSFGASLLSALEKKDVDDLARLRLHHQKTVAALTTASRRMQVEAAEKALETLHLRRAATEYRKQHFKGLADGLVTPLEILQMGLRGGAIVAHAGAAVLDVVAAVAHLVPEAGAPTAMKWGGLQVGNSSYNWAGLARDVSSILNTSATLAGTAAGFERRKQGWDHQVSLAEHELKQFDKQIEASTIQWEIAVEQLAVHERSIEHIDEVEEFYGDKFTGLGLYTWLSSTLQRLHRSAYNSALAMARLAEQAFVFERGDDEEALLGASHWEAGRAGLLAGEQLLIELQNLERRFIETDDRRLEVDQAFSLQQIDPGALVSLRETGECEFVLPELYFDLFYPGQYRRLIKSVRLTIPCVTGPYTNVSATLRLLESEVRLDSASGAAPVAAPLSRTNAIATSTAQNDAGVFEMSFRGERYLPFEGAGAVNSRWQLSLPASFTPFDYQTINDAIIRVNYTAEEDGALRARVDSLNASLEGSIAKTLKDDGLVRLFRFRHDFATVLQRLVAGPAGTKVPFDVVETHFPIFLRGKSLSVSRALLALRPSGGGSPGSAAIKIDGSAPSSQIQIPELGNLRGWDLGSAFSGDPKGRHEIELTALGDLADGGSTPALLDDILLLVEYGT